jgi:hypothetical protein
MSARIKPIRVGGRQLEEIRDADPDGRPVLHSQVIDPLARMLRAGTITDSHHCGPAHRSHGSAKAARGPRAAGKLAPHSECTSASGSWQLWSGSSRRRDRDGALESQL